MGHDPLARLATIAKYTSDSLGLVKLSIMLASSIWRAARGFKEMRNTPRFRDARPIGATVAN